jgi:hypothetical protein
MLEPFKNLFSCKSKDFGIALRRIGIEGNYHLLCPASKPRFCTFLDATKALDRLHVGKIFGLLLERDLPVQIARTLTHLYTHNYVRTRWREVVSHYFSVTNGVKQGAVLTPIFLLYLH